MAVQVKLRVARTEANQRLEDALSKANQLTQSRGYKVLSYTKELHGRNFKSYINDLFTYLFDGDEPINTWEDNWAKSFYYSGGVNSTIQQLENLLDRISFMETPANMPPSSTSVVPTSESSQPQDIFIMDGHDEGAKEAAARFIEKLALRAIILEERPNAGRTIIQKFEEEASKVGFAVVLLTPDDVAASNEDPQAQKQRARQNAIFELGWFAARLGRGKVCILHQGDIEIPSDLYGVLYTPMDTNRGWQTKLAREMRQAGIVIDLNRLAD